MAVVAAGRREGGLLAMGGRERDDSCFLFFLPAQSRLIFAKQYKFTDELPSQPSSPVMDLPGKKAVPLPAGCSFFATYDFKL